MSNKDTLTGQTPEQLIDQHGIHKFLAGEKSASASKGSHYPCRVCGASKKHSVHKSGGVPVTKNVPQAASDGDNVCVKCPSCKGTGTIVFTTDEILKLAGKRLR